MRAVVSRNSRLWPSPECPPPPSLTMIQQGQGGQEMCVAVLIRKTPHPYLNVAAAAPFLCVTPPCCEKYLLLGRVHLLPVWFFSGATDSPGL